MAGEGIFAEDFSLGLGDFLELGDEEQKGNQMAVIQNGADTNQQQNEQPRKVPKEAFPSIDSQLSAAELVGKYKKAILNRQAAYRDIHEKWAAASPATGQLLGQFSVRLFWWDRFFFEKKKKTMSPGLSGKLWRSQTVSQLVVSS